MDENAKEKLSASMRNKCLPQCWRAKAPECVCACGGKNHGKAVNESGRIQYDWHPGKELTE